MENRFTRLEDRQEKDEERTMKCVRDNKEAKDIQVKKIVGVIDRVVDKLATSIKQLQSQLSEQKQVTDWVKREYNLRPVKKV